MSARKRIFVSHAVADRSITLEVAGLLEAAGHQVTVDTVKLRPGDNFVAFMNDALEASEYCLLLWSQAAARSEWVREELCAAYVRSVQERRAFLILARLDTYEIPSLLKPRIFIDMSANLLGGVDRVLDTITRDTAVREKTQREVGSPAVELPSDPDGAEIYVISELFNVAIPVRLSTATPVAFHLQRLLDALRLPREASVHGVVIRYRYSIYFRGSPLDGPVSLAGAGVVAGDALELRTEMSFVPAVSPIEGALFPISFRGEYPSQKGRTVLAEAVRNLGLETGPLDRVREVHE